MSASRGALIGALLSVPVIVAAQDQPATTESRAALETIIVTAHKRAQSSQDVPVAIAALTGESLEKTGISDIFDVAMRVPPLGVQNNEKPLSTQFRLRGIGNFGSIPNFEPAVAYFSDGAFRSRSGLGIGDLVDLDRIEILKGQQSTLYGKNATAGGIVGGALFDLREAGAVTAQLAASMLLNGCDADSNRVVQKRPPAFDWRELHPWLAIDAGQFERNGSGDASQMRRDLVHLSEDVHALSYRLHPSMLYDLGLVDALRAECERVANHGGVKVEVDAEDVPGTVSNEASLCLYRVAQEALNNAVRHGRANAMTVLLSTYGNGVQLAVSDNGSGFDPNHVRVHASLDLASMRERVRMSHGQLDIESTPGRGTTVVAWVPR